MTRPGIETQVSRAIGEHSNRWAQCPGYITKPNQNSNYYVLYITIVYHIEILQLNIQLNKKYVSCTYFWQLNIRPFFELKNQSYRVIIYEMQPV